MFKQIFEYMVQLSSKVTIAHISDVPCRYSRYILHAFQTLHVHFLDASRVDEFHACLRRVLHVFQISRAGCVWDVCEHYFGAELYRMFK